MTASVDILERLMVIIESRRKNPPERSYTTSLFQSGVPKIGAKILEEAGEFVEAGREVSTAEQRAHLIHEAADLIYHMFVMMGYHQIRLEEVATELAKRFGTSGLDEKESRTLGEEE